MTITVFALHRLGINGKIFMSKYCEFLLEGLCYNDVTITILQFTKENEERKNGFIIRSCFHAYI